MAQAAGAFLFTLVLLQIHLASAQSRSPQQVVKLFMQVYGTERMREILPYTLPAFRDGLEPEVWLEEAYRDLKSIGYVHLEGVGYVHLEGVIKDISIDGKRARVVVHSRIRTIVGTARQTEIYLLRLTDQGWKLFDIEVRDEVIEEAPPGSLI
jgi:hypothetical protein